LFDGLDRGTLGEAGSAVFDGVFPGNANAAANLSQAELGPFASGIVFMHRRQSGPLYDVMRLPLGAERR
jgi:hypothetical protein